MDVRQLTVTIPDDVAERPGPKDDVARRALEAFARDEFREGRVAKPELRRLLGLPTRDALDGFLKVRGVYEP